MKKKTLAAFAACPMLFIISCDALSGVANSIIQPDARTRYERNAKDHPRLALWQEAHADALNDDLEVNLPYAETGAWQPLENPVYSYNFGVTEGESLNLRLQDSAASPFFVGLYIWDDGWTPVGKDQAGSPVMAFEPEQSGVYKIVIQPGLDAAGAFAFALEKTPRYGFPVAGKGNAAIQSFWADARDEGQRKHEGIDIFARRGTPVLAVTDGTIAFTGERGLGGKQVWQREGLFGKSIYYAHLDRIAAAEGSRIKKGDTIGYVGNTGNAKGCPPHLHFGIYGAGGAVDPLPYVEKSRALPLPRVPETLPHKGAIAQKSANLRKGPSQHHARLAVLPKSQTMTILGKTGDWFHIASTAGKGFVHRSLVRIES
jgi:murein DD-endopeptidase MepM/ murein hydrolase activator NlpD